MWQNTITCNVGTAQCEEGTIKYEEKNKRNHQIWQIQLGTAQCEDDTIKCEKKINEPPNVAKYSHM